VRRTDPLTGLTVRITGHRPHDPGGWTGDLPDVSEEAARTAVSCPFCGDRVLTRTPRFPQELVPGGRIRRGGAILFPNLAPYGPFSAVTTLSPDHHVPLGSFTEGMMGDALANCLELATRVAARHPEVRFATISQNVLPSSGGALFHPHLQVNVDDAPMGWHRLVLGAFERYPGGPGLLHRLARDAEGAGRGIGRTGRWRWFTPFAPMTSREVHAVHGGAGTASDLAGEDLQHFVRGLLAIQAAVAAEGRNAFNLGLFLSLREPQPFIARMMPRAPYRPWYRSDRSCYEVALLEGVTDQAPEQVAARLRAAWPFEGWD